MSDTTETGPDAQVDQATRDEEAREATSSHGADRQATPEEEAAAEQSDLEPGVAAHEREMGRIGAEEKGEGRID